MTNADYPTRPDGRSIPTPAVAAIVGLGALWAGAFVRTAGAGYFFEGVVIAGVVVTLTLGSLYLLGAVSHGGDWHRAPKAARGPDFAVNGSTYTGHVTPTGTSGRHRLGDNDNQWAAGEFVNPRRAASTARWRLRDRNLSGPAGRGDRRDNGSSARS